MLLKSDKGQGIVVVNKKDYYDSLGQLFNENNYNPSTNQFLFLVELSLFSTRAFENYVFSFSLTWHIKTYPSSVSTYIKITIK